MDVIPLAVFDRLVEMLIKADLVSESNSVLTWIGPNPNPNPNPNQNEIPAGKVGIA
jgi:hypothetical protein